MPISHEYRFIYIHIPKCAGKSVTNAFKQQNVRLDFLGPALPEHREQYGITDMWLHHIPASSLRGTLPEETWSKYFKFTFVRNPWDLVVSYYHYHLKEVAESPEFHKQWPKIVDRFRRTNNFADWVGTGLYIQPSSNFIMDREGKLLVDFVGRFETLQEDFRTVCGQIGLQAHLGHENKTEHAPYREYYDEVAKETVEARFRNDIEFFGYEF